MFQEAVVVLTRNEKNERVILLPLEEGRRIAVFRDTLTFKKWSTGYDTFPDLIKNYGMTEKQIDSMIHFGLAKKKTFEITFDPTLEECKRVKVTVVKIKKGYTESAGNLHMYNCVKPGGYRFKLVDGQIIRNILFRMSEFES